MLVVALPLTVPAAAQTGGSRFAPPVVVAVAPDGGPASGGTTVTISGSGFSLAVGVSFGGRAATSFRVVSDSRITAIAPPGLGAQDVMVVASDGISTPTSADVFSYAQGLAPDDTSLATAAGVATPATVTLDLSSGPAPAAPATQLGLWAPLDFVQFQPMAPLMQTLRDFTTATAAWDEASRTATVTAGADTLTVSVGSGTATLVMPGDTQSLPVDPPARLTSSGTLSVPLALLAELVGGQVAWSPGATTATLTATSYDPAMAQAEALLALLAPPPGAMAAGAASVSAPAGSLPQRTPPLRDASDQWSLAQPGDVLGWVAAQAQAIGLGPVGAGPSSAGGGARSEAFALDGVPAGWGWIPEIDVTLETAGNGLFVRYDALVADPPLPSGPLPAYAQSVTVTPQSASGAPAGLVQVVVDPVTVARLTLIVDGLGAAAASGVPAACTAGAGAVADVRLDFAYQGTNAPTYTVTEGVGCQPGLVSLVGPSGGRPTFLDDPVQALARAAGVS